MIAIASMDGRWKSWLKDLQTREDSMTLALDDSWSFAFGMQLKVTVVRRDELMRARCLMDVIEPSEEYVR